MQPEHLEFSLSSLYNLFCKKNYWAPPQILQLYSEVMMLKFNDRIYKLLPLPQEAKR